MYGAFKFHFVGTCAADPEYSKLQNGTDRVSLNIVVNTPQKQDNGSYESRATWVRVAFFGEASQRKSITFCKKGIPVYCEGSVNSYTEELPNKKLTMYNFKADLIRPLAWPKDERQEQDNRGDPNEKSGPAGTTTPDGELPDCFS